MDEHARRVTAGVRRALDDYEAGSATVADIQSTAAGAAGALDSTNTDLRNALERLDTDLEMIRFTVSVEDERSAVQSASADLRRFLD
jgi:hypothetical protein